MKKITVTFNLNNNTPKFLIPKIVTQCDNLTKFQFVKNLSVRNQVWDFENGEHVNLPRETTQESRTIGNTKNQISFFINIHNIRRSPFFTYLFFFPTTFSKEYTMMTPDPKTLWMLNLVCMKKACLGVLYGVQLFTMRVRDWLYVAGPVCRVLTYTLHAMYDTAHMYAWNVFLWIERNSVHGSIGAVLLCLDFGFQTLNSMD